MKFDLVGYLTDRGIKDDLAIRFSNLMEGLYAPREIKTDNGSIDFKSDKGDLSIVSSKESDDPFGPELKGVYSGMNVSSTGEFIEISFIDKNGFYVLESSKDSTYILFYDVEALENLVEMMQEDKSYNGHAHINSYAFESHNFLPDKKVDIEEDPIAFANSVLKDPNVLISKLNQTKTL